MTVYTSQSDSRVNNINRLKNALLEITINNLDLIDLLAHSSIFSPIILCN
jgi:hypothetical protein